MTAEEMDKRIKQILPNIDHVDRLITLMAVIPDGCFNSDNIYPLPGLPGYVFFFETPTGDINQWYKQDHLAIDERLFFNIAGIHKEYILHNTKRRPKKRIGE